MDTNVKAFLGLIIFIMLMGAMGLVYKKFTGGTSLLKRSGKYMKTVDRMMVSNDKWIELVEVGGKVILLGITGTSITRLDTFEMEELNELEPLEQASFRDILGRYGNGKKN